MKGFQMCFVFLILMLGPRLTILYIAIATNYFSQAYDTTILPFLGFFIMPWTTLAYMGAMLNNNYQLSGEWLVIVIIGIIFDLGSIFTNTESIVR